MKKLKWKKLSRCIEFRVLDGRQVASLIPINGLLEPRHEALAALICFDPALLLNRVTRAVLSRQFGLHPILVVERADDWPADRWCGIEEVLAGCDGNPAFTNQPGVIAS